MVGWIWIERTELKNFINTQLLIQIKQYSRTFNFFFFSSWINILRLSENLENETLTCFLSLLILFFSSFLFTIKDNISKIYKNILNKSNFGIKKFSIKSWTNLTFDLQGEGLERYAHIPPKGFPTQNPLIRLHRTFFASRAGDKVNLENSKLDPTPFILDPDMLPCLIVLNSNKIKRFQHNIRALCNVFKVIILAFKCCFLSRHVLS